MFQVLSPFGPSSQAPTFFPLAGSLLVSLRHPAFTPSGTFGGPNCSRQFVEPEEVQISVAQTSASKNGLFKLENGASVEAEEMARSGGFEPPTAWFVARYSIQLSYERASSWGAYYRVRLTAVNYL